MQKIIEENLYNFVKQNEIGLDEVDYEKQKELYSALKAHQINDLCYASLRQAFHSKLRSRYKNRYMRNQLNKTLKEKSFFEVVNLFNKEKIDYIILKGISYSLLYINPNHRTMGDIDIMAKISDFHKIEHLLTSLGYKRKNDLDAFHLVYDRDHSYRIEIHQDLLDSEKYIFSKALTSHCFNNIVEETYSQINFRVLNIEYRIITCIVHMYKHVNTDGFGYKQLIDLYYLVSREHKSEIVRDYFLNNEMMRFYELVMMLLHDYFYYQIDEVKVSTDYVEYMKRDIFASGVYGFSDKERYMNIRLADYTSSENSTILSYIFPSKNHMIKQEKYAYCKNGILLPVGWLHRILYNLMKKRISVGYYEKNQINIRKEFISWLKYDK